MGKLTVQKAREMAKEKLKRIVEHFKLKLREFKDDPVKTGNESIKRGCTGKSQATTRANAPSEWYFDAPNK